MQRTEKTKQKKTRKNRQICVHIPLYLRFWSFKFLNEALPSLSLQLTIINVKGTCIRILWYMKL